MRLWLYPAITESVSHWVYCAHKTTLQYDVIPRFVDVEAAQNNCSLARAQPKK
jgi:hypothetical protein